MHNQYAFVAGNSGSWRLLSMRTLRGPDLSPAQRIDLVPAGAYNINAPASWVLQGVISNVRYATRTEFTALKASQEPLGRPAARRAALIPIRKSPAWWALAQDERRAIFEETSHHTAIGLEYLPAIARQLFHCRDINEPFDFLTWFEYAPEHAAEFENLVSRLRSTPEWNYVEREVDIRLELV
jgi:chlorite dismutase